MLALGLDLDAIDAQAARHAGAKRPADDPRAVAIQGRAGLPWYRGMARGDERVPMAGNAHVDAMLAHFGARHVAIGHTLAAYVGHTHGGRVLRTDVHHAGGVHEGLLFADGAWWRVDAAGTRVPLQATTNLHD